MARFKSFKEAKSSLEVANKEIKKILDKDLEPVSEIRRSVDLWVQIFGNDPAFKERKDYLTGLEMTVIDAEIFCLYSQDHTMNLTDTLA